MTTPNAESFDQFISWKKSYETCVMLINEQHKGILSFINHWYYQIKAKGPIADLPQFVQQKFGFLTNFSKGHLRFESELLRLLKDEYGFPAVEYNKHMEKHRKFLELFLMPLTRQLKQEEGRQGMIILEDMAKGGLVDTARWWYHHIRDPKTGEAPGPDQIYRTFLRQLSMSERLEIVNRMTVYIALHDNVFWLKDTKDVID